MEIDGDGDRGDRSGNSNAPLGTGTNTMYIQCTVLWSYLRKIRTKVCTVCPFPDPLSPVLSPIYLITIDYWAVRFSFRFVSFGLLPPLRSLHFLPRQWTSSPTRFPQRFLPEEVLSYWKLCFQRLASRADHWQKRGSCSGNHGVRRPYHIAVSRRPVSSLQMREVIRDAMRRYSISAESLLEIGIYIIYIWIRYCGLSRLESWSHHQEVQDSPQWSILILHAFIRWSMYLILFSLLGCNGSLRSRECNAES
jgi:hypothetical protein